MAISLNIPVPTAAFRQPRLVLKNRSARRSRSRVIPEPALPTSNGSSSIELPPLPSLPSVNAQDGGTHTEPPAASSTLSQAVLLDWLGSQPVAFHRVYVNVCGSVTAAVWLSMVLSLLDGNSSQVDAQGIFRFRLSAKSCEEQTGLTESEQRKAQRQLVDCQLLTIERKKAGQATPTHSLDMNRLTQRLLVHSEGLAELLEQNASTPAPLVDTSVLERRAQVRASRRRA